MIGSYLNISTNHITLLLNRSVSDRASVCTLYGVQQKEYLFCNS